MKLSSKYNTGEITTILTLITFLVIGISSIISSTFLKNNKNKINTTSKAMETCECDYGCYPDGSCKPAPNEQPSPENNPQPQPPPVASSNNSPGCGPDNPELCIQQQNNQPNEPQPPTPTEAPIEQPTPVPPQNDYCQKNPWDCNGSYFGPPTEAPIQTPQQSQDDFCRQFPDDSSCRYKEVHTPVNPPSSTYITPTASPDEERYAALGEYCKTHQNSPTCGGNPSPTPDYSDWTSRHMPTQIPSSKAQDFCTANFTQGTKDYNDCINGYSETVTVSDDTTVVVNPKSNQLSKLCRQTLQEDCSCITDDTCMAHAYQLVSYSGANKFTLPPVPPLDVKAPPPAYVGNPATGGPYSAYIHVIPNLMKDDAVGVADVTSQTVDAVIHDTNTKLVRLAVSGTNFSEVETQWQNELNDIQAANSRNLDTRLVIESYNMPSLDEWKNFLNGLKQTDPNKLPNDIIFGNEIGGHTGGYAGDIKSGDAHYSYLNMPHSALSDPVNGLPAYTALLYQTSKEIEKKTGKKIGVSLPSIDWNYEQVPGNLEKYLNGMQQAGVDLNDPRVTVDMHMFSAIEPPFPFDSSGPERVMQYKKILTDLGHPNTNITIGELYYGKDFSPDQIQRYVNYYKQLGVKKITLYPSDWK